MNFFERFDWETMRAAHPVQNYDISEYHKLLCPPEDYPHFMDKYIALPIMQRLSGIGLLCGTDWTKLYRNRLYYSRLDHSKGVALIVWHFTHDKAQTLAGLFHDVSTPVFSHVSDFRKGDALTQTATEAPTAAILRGDAELGQRLAEDNLTVEQVEDYHIYPVADNEIPQLSADRLEYMFPSGMALDGSWTMEEIRRCYDDLAVLTNEHGTAELGFLTLETAELYCERFCMTGHILQLNENKLALQLLGQVMNLAAQEGVLQEEDFMRLSEREVIEKLEEALSEAVPPEAITTNTRLRRLYKTFRTMTKIEHTAEPLPVDEWFCVNLKVKQRYINPLVQISGTKSVRLSEVSEKARTIITDFLAYSDTPYGCVKLY